jgi:hypothetical protein
MKKTRKTHSCNKINKKYIKKMKRKTKKNRNGYKYRQKHNNMTGGDIPELGEFIGRGTHGLIRTILANNSQVVKIFDNRVIQKKSLCKKITEQYNSTCDELNYEYEIQKIIRDSFIKNNLEITVPKVFDFSIDSASNKCYYIMNRVFPLSDNILLVDMTNATNEINITDVGKHIGYENVSNYLSITPIRLANLIGRMFSLLHFILNLDGYDCELLVGKDNLFVEEPKLYLIDYDKVSCFDFTLDQTIFRKISEEYFEEKLIKTPKNLASVLFSSFISMSLLPVDLELKHHFLEGYHVYFNPKTEIEMQVMDEIIKRVNDYEI